MTERKKTPTSIGGVKEVVFTITEPVAMDMSLEVNKLNVFVGMNGTGKSFIMKIVWAFGYIANAIILARHLNHIPTAQFVLDNTFAEQNIHGTLEVIFDSGTNLLVISDHGKVNDVKYVIPDTVVEPSRPVFMSANMRRFDAISYYLQDRRRTGKKGEELFFEMLKSYKLYDVSHIESMIARCPIKLSDVLQQRIVDFGIQDVTRLMEKDMEHLMVFDFDEKKDDFFIGVGDPDKNRVYMRFMGSGHQSLVNMFIGGLQE